MYKTIIHLPLNYGDSNNSYVLEYKTQEINRINKIMNSKSKLSFIENFKQELTLLFGLDISGIRALYGFTKSRNSTEKKSLEIQILHMKLMS